jgi:hypothetical protein
VAATAEHEQLRPRAIFDRLSHGNQRRTPVGQQHQLIGCSLTVEGLQSNAKGLDADRGILKGASIAINGLTS